MALALSGLAITSYKAKAAKLGNASVWALQNMPTREGMNQLHILKDKVRDSNAQKKIAKALEVIAQQ